MNIFKIVILSLLVISFASCKRNYADSAVKAPTNISASNGNAFVCGTLGLGIPSPDFSLNLNQTFTATFSETVTWKIELIGKTSAATKTISATSSVINASNSTWIGNHDGLYFFEMGETVTANLIVSGKAGICSSTTFTIATVRDAKTPTTTFMLINPNKVGNQAMDYNSDFEIPTSNGYPTQFTIGAKSQSIYTFQNQVIRAPEGKSYMHIEGVSADANGFFVGGLQCRMNATAQFNPTDSTNFFPKSWTDPSKIYLNVYIGGIDQLPAGNLPYAQFNFECHEDDNRNPSTVDNCSYYAQKPAGTSTDYFCPSSEDAWVFKVIIRHTGWQLFSCKYSDLLPSEDFANGGFGNRKLEPQKMARVQFGLVSSPPFNRVSANIDYACFTYGAPYDPTK